MQASLWQELSESEEVVFECLRFLFAESDEANLNVHAFLSRLTGKGVCYSSALWPLKAAFEEQITKNRRETELKLLIACE